MAADSAPRDRMAYAIGTVQTAQRLGPAIGPIIGGDVAQLVGLRRAFLVTAGFYVVALVLVFWMYRRTPRTPRRTGSPREAARHVPQRAGVRELRPADGGRLRAAVRRSQLRPGAAAVSSPSSARRATRAARGRHLLFSIAAGAGAVGHHVVRPAAARAPGAATVIAASAAAGRGWSSWLCLRRRHSACCCWRRRSSAWRSASRPPRAYTAAGGVIPATARGAGFGLLTTASLVGLALEPDRQRLPRHHEHPRGVPARRRWRCVATCGRASAPDGDAVAMDAERRAGAGGDLMTGNPMMTVPRSIAREPNVRRRRCRPRRACSRRGGVVAYPTDTLYGLAVDPRQRRGGGAAVRREGPGRERRDCR